MPRVLPGQLHRHLPDPGSSNPEPGEFPSGWDDQRVREVLNYYENQSDEEAAAEHEAALSSPDHTVMEVPAELVPVFRQLIAEHERKRPTR